MNNNDNPLMVLWRDDIVNLYCVLFYMTDITLFVLTTKTTALKKIMSCVTKLTKFVPKINGRTN